MSLMRIIKFEYDYGTGGAIEYKFAFAACSKGKINGVSYRLTGLS